LGNGVFGLFIDLFTHSYVAGIAFAILVAAILLRGRF
jgi:hypothetical protein